MSDGPYLSTDPNAGQPASAGHGYLSTDPTAGTTPDLGYGWIGDLARGAGKGVIEDAVRLGELVHKIPGVSAAVDRLYGVPGLSRASFDAAHQALARTTTAEKVGDVAGQLTVGALAGGPIAGAADAAEAAVAPRLAPYVGQAVAKLIPQAAVQATGGAGISALQGGSPTAGAVIGGGLPVVGAVVRGTAGAAQRLGQRLATAGLKVPKSLVEELPGQYWKGLGVSRDELVQYIVNRGLTTSAQANELVDQAERGVQRAMALANPPTDAPARAATALDALKTAASRMGIQGPELDQIAAAQQGLLAGPMAQDVTTTVMRPSSILGPNGQPVLTPTPVTTRALQASYPADAALKSARASSRFRLGQSFGEQQSIPNEATKAVELAQRNAVKDAYTSIGIPEVASNLKEESQAIAARDALQAMEMRQGNRDVLGLGGHLILASGIPAVSTALAAGPEAGAVAGATGLLAAGSLWLRNNQLTAGIWADRMAQALKSQDTAAVADILRRVGQAGVGPATRPTPTLSQYAGATP